MPRLKTTLDLYFDVEDRWADEGALADGINALMDHLMDLTANRDGFALIDWSFVERSPGDYAYPEPFDGPTPEEELQADLEAAEKAR